MQRSTTSDPTVILKNCHLIKQQLLPEGFGGFYMILDTETTGLSIHEDLPIDMALLVAHQRKVIHSYHTYLDWTRVPNMDVEWFNRRLTATNEAMWAQDPKTKRMTMQELRGLGNDPRVALADLGNQINHFIQHCEGTLKCRPFFVGHNAHAFDLNILHRAYSAVGLPTPMFSDVLDTGLLVKAAQMHDFPQPAEKPVDWMMRVRNKPARIKWSLQRFCRPTFALEGYLPDFFQSDIPHTSLADAMLVFALLEAIDGSMGSGDRPGE